MKRSSLRSAGLAILLTMNGCGGLVPLGSASRAPGLDVARAALEGGAGQIALQISDGVLRESPNNIRAMEIKGDALSLLGDYDQATAVYRALLAQDQNSVRATIGLGRIRLAKDPAAAEALFQQALNREPKDLTALNNLGIARDLQGRHADAQTVYRQALGINPDLDSARVNLALSMAMSGQGKAATQLLESTANQPGASAKVRHDYAVVLALAGNRPEAERVLSDDLAPDEVRQVLDSVTGSHTSLARDAAPEPIGLGRAALASRVPADDVPPDVVQVPEAAPPQTALSGTERTAARPAVAATRSAMAPAAGPPMVVRPRPGSEPESDSSETQSVGPVAAAVTNQRSLALPIRSSAYLGGAPAVEATPDASLVTPEVVAVAPARPAPRMAVVDAAGANAEAERLALPEAPPPPAVLRPAPLPPAYQPLPPTTQAEPSVRRLATAPETLGDAGRAAARAGVEQADAAPADPARAEAARSAQAEPARAEAARAATARAEAAPVEAARAAAAQAEATRAEAGLAAAAAEAARVEAARAMVAQAEAARAKAARAATAQADAAWSERARPEGTWATARWTDAAQFEIARETGPTVQAVRAVSMAAATLGAAAHAVPAAVAPTPTTATESDDARSAPAPIGRLEASTPVVQLAAAPSEEAAHSFWQDLVHRFPEALGQREPVVIRFEHGGTVFWRVRAEGFATPAEAQTLCARMRADGQECFVPRS